MFQTYIWTLLDYIHNYITV